MTLLAGPSPVQPRTPPRSAAAHRSHDPQLVGPPARPRRHAADGRRRRHQHGGPQGRARSALTPSRHPLSHSGVDTGRLLRLQAAAAAFDQGPRAQASEGVPLVQPVPLLRSRKTLSRRAHSWRTARPAPVMGTIEASPLRWRAVSRRRRPKQSPARKTAGSRMQPRRVSSGRCPVTPVAVTPRRLPPSR